MQVSKFIEVDETFEIKDVMENQDRTQALFIGEYEDRVELFFREPKPLEKQFSDQLNKQIKEVEK